MLYYLYEWFGAQTITNVFKYISFRTLMAASTSFLVALIAGRWFISALTHRHIGQEIRTDGPQSHLKKKGTPTMGGLMILGTIIISVLLWARWDNRFVWNALAVCFGFGALGLMDDYRKVARHNSKGLSPRGKILLQTLLALGIGASLFFYGFDSTLHFPFFKGLQLDLGGWFIPFAALVIISTSNAVNLTDGLDGLAIGPMMIAAASYLIFAYIAGHFFFSTYLMVPHVPGAGELSVVCAAVLGSGLGFLWYNTYPAQVFMGDVGSLSLGALLGYIAVVTKQEILLILVGLVFVLETLSVVIQVASFKMLGRRFFKMAPLHHHFELKGWAEPKIIVRFWIISIIATLLSLSALKLR
ncbi:MAG: phospho-N-acetylmuramoyl-pentapeptide-transferase [Deltaproteobacteria bacterium RIFOXYA12_FULL_61_11]|nr:MAG: phospho-N-acetylmuramoyl-pentapeptide-transferase [Deltaproteobacteria bacterium RIFOXYA12_FULL_61_11]